MENTLSLQIVQALQSKDLETTDNLLVQLFKEYPDSPVFHLYLGIRSEIQKQTSLAMRHYRASLALDGTFKPALENLYRLGDGKKFPIYYGIEEI